ncbi:FAD binding domain-containing protein [Bordetella genomosp. 4]|uniref:FAD binding domain-containing protein n=1 Tax=Bordetella genomosp. 4 TaxID=463044 RepID=UPI000B9DE554|nr:FAD binding domain-containing protein [Bordetella genomosp. 4]OZI43330.1 carbon monoxide dehydrogenase [Bordetella genomosp. 4]
MKPQAFDYLRADSAQDAVDALAELGSDGRILAGGQSLMAVLNMRLAQPTALIDISRAADLDYVKAENGWLTVGAAATQAKVEWRPDLHNEVPMLAQAIPFISHFQIRNRGTVCGSVAHADPSAELPLVLAALGGEVLLRTRRKQRVLSAEEFFQGMLMTARAADEIVEAVRYPMARPGARYAFDEFSSRHGDFAIVSVAAVADDRQLTLAVGGVADRPTVQRWPRLQGSDLEAAVNDFAWQLDAQDDAHASAIFRRHLIRMLGARALQRVTERGDEVSGRKP